MELSNAFMYGDRLRCDSLDVADAKLEYTSSTYLSSWLLAKEGNSQFYVYIFLSLLSTALLSI